MKQTSMLSVLFARGQALSQNAESPVREPGGDTFSRAFQTARTDRQATASPRTADRDPATTRADVRETDSELAPAESTSPAGQSAPPLASATRQSDSEVVQAGDEVVAKEVDTEAMGEMDADTNRVYAVAAKVLDLQVLDAPAREQLTGQLLTLREALRSGELNEQEALEALEGLLQANGLALDGELKQLWRTLAETQNTEGDKQQLPPIVALLDGLRQLLVDANMKETVDQHRGDGIVAGQMDIQKGGVGEMNLNRPGRTGEDLPLPPREVASFPEREGRVARPWESVAERKVVVTVAPRATGEAVDEKSGPGIVIKESSAALKETEVVLKNVALGEGDGKTRAASDRAVLFQALLSDRGATLPTGLQAPAASTLAAAPIPTERGFTVQTMVNTLVGQPNWGQAVGQRVMWLAQQNIAEAQLRLDPPDLGPVKVKISVHNEQAQVVFTSHSPAVREALDQSAQRLRELFAEQGLDLVNVDVSDQQQGSADDESREESGLFQGRRGNIESDGVETPQWVMEGQVTLVDHYA